MEFARACDAATGGNPFLLSRLAAGLRDQGIAFAAANAGEVTGAGVAAVRDAVATTLARLSPDAVALGQAIAVLGDDIELTLAAQLAGVDAEAADVAVEQLVRAAVLADARPLRFVHAIVRDGVAVQLPAGVRGALHARAAELLASRHAAPDAVAGHLLETEPRGRPYVVERLMAAARQALAQGAPETALTYLERALAEPPATATVHAELLLDLACAANELGQRAVLEHVRAAYVLAPSPVLRARAALELIWQGGSTLDVAELVALLEHAISDLRDDDDRELILELEAARLAALHTRAPLLSTSWAGELQRWANLQGETPAERLLLAQLAVAHMNSGASARVAGEFAERAASGPDFEHTGRGGMSLMFALRALVKTDRLDSAERMLERELRGARQRGSLRGYQVVCFFRGVVALRRGLLSSAEAHLRAGLDAVPPHVWRRRQVIAHLLDVLVQTGDLVDAQALLTADGWDADLPDDEASNFLLATRSGLRLAQGDPRRALDDALEARRRRVRQGSVKHVNWDGWSHGWSRIALLYHRLGDRDTARCEADALLVAARRWDTPGAIGQALHTAALIDEGEHGLALLRDAVEHLERSPARLDHARALIDFGAALRRRGDRRAARDQLRHGLDIAAACGAQPLTERARQELTATGIRVRRDAQTGLAALTPSERRIIEHAASGATNRQIAQALFITVKTVEMHLQNAYRKLDITSRHQLAQHLRATTPQ
jgi:DNA-binding CsgD family transcriptional regulator